MLEGGGFMIRVLNMEHHCVRVVLEGGGFCDQSIKYGTPLC